MVNDSHELQNLLSEYFIKNFNMPKEEADENAYEYALVLSAYRSDLLKIAALSEKKGIKTNVLIDCLAIAIRVSESEDEKDPFGTGAFLGNTIEILEKLGEGLVVSPIQGVSFSPRQWDWIIDKVRDGVDGEVAAFSIDGNTGIVSDARKLPDKLDPYSHITNESVNTIAFHVPNTKLAVRLYSDGEMVHQLVKVRNVGLWMSRYVPSIRAKVLSIISQKTTIKPEVIKALLGFALQLSETRKGATYVIGEIDQLCKEVKMENPEKIEKKQLALLARKEMLNYSTKDGATLVDGEGNLVSFGVKFVATGGRYKSTVEVTKTVGSVFAIVISVDGKVRLANNGMSVPIID